MQNSILLRNVEEFSTTTARIVCNIMSARWGLNPAPPLSDMFSSSQRYAWLHNFHWFLIYFKMPDYSYEYKSKRPSTCPSNSARIWLQVSPPRHYNSAITFNTRCVCNQRSHPGLNKYNSEIVATPRVQGHRGHSNCLLQSCPSPAPPPNPHPELAPVNKTEVHTKKVKPKSGILGLTPSNIKVKIQRPVSFDIKILSQLCEF